MDLKFTFKCACGRASDPWSQGINLTRANLLRNYHLKNSKSFRKWHVTQWKMSYKVTTGVTNVLPVSATHIKKEYLKLSWFLQKGTRADIPYHEIELFQRAWQYCWTLDKKCASKRKNVIHLLFHLSLKFLENIYLSYIYPESNNIKQQRQLMKIPEHHLIFR